MSALYVLEREMTHSAQHAGAKAANLGQLADRFSVPDFFVIAAEAFADGAILPGARTPLAHALAKLGAGPFAVRSSAREEDGAQHAHAGQYETRLGVDAEYVLAAAESVWRSGFSDRLAHYRTAKGLSAEPRPPAVIVQLMIEPRAAGIAFSACPLTGDRESVIISAVHGRADRLAAGEVDGDLYRVAKTGAVTADRDANVLTDSDCRALAKLARACAAHFGAPQDIEWAFDGDKLCLLQARPITALAANHSGAKQDTLTIWDNSNIVESYPGIVSPLTFSFAQYVYAHVYRAFAGLMGVSGGRVAAHDEVFDNLLGRIDGRVYYNLLNWYRALALFPGFKSNRAFMEQMMGVGEALPPDLASRIAPPAQGVWTMTLDHLRLIRVAAGLVFHGCALKRTSARFRERLDAGLATPIAEIDVASATALASEYRRLERLLLTNWDAPLINDFLCMIGFGASRQVLAAWAGREGLALHGDVMIGQGDIISAEPAHRIRAMGAMAKSTPALIDALAAGDRSALASAPVLAAAFAAYLARFGDRCVQELKLESIPLHDDPTQLLFAIAAAARAPERAARTDTAAPYAQLRGLFKGRPLKRALVAWLLAWAKARVRDRENLRFERTRLFGRVRRIFLALGARLAEAGVLGDPRDIFHLTVQEALAAAEFTDAGDSLKQRATQRRGEDAASAPRPDPPERIETGAGARSVTPPVEVLGETRAGLACCTGIAIARVRVIADPRLETLAPGEILVARSTDPGWIAVFANAAGIIVERGSLLSHSAIVAREMGVPCVVGLKGATQWLRSGDLVRLDGGAGLVERVQS